MSESRPRTLRRVGRRPLADTTAVVNNTLAPSPARTSEACLSSKYENQALPPPNRRLRVVNPDGPGPANVEDRRISAVVAADDHQHASKRSSQTSTTSTNASAKSRRKTHVGPWQLGGTLGRGSTARVRKGRHVVTGQLAAIKIISKTAFTGDQSKKDRAQLAYQPNPDDDRQLPFGIEREVVIMKLLNHPHVIRLYDLWENRGELYLVLEYVDGGELFNYILHKGGLQEWEAIRYFRQLLAGLSYCHAFSICHRDLKLENILLDKDMNVKIADFGFAALQPHNRLLETPCGSPHYVAPEVITKTHYRGDLADIWSCGVILYIFLTGVLPWDDSDVDRVLQKVARGQYTLPTHLSPEAANLLHRILQVEPAERITMAEIWKHPLIRKYEAVAHADGDIEWYARPPSFPAVLDLCRPGSRSEIDREILRNIHSLWHRETREELVRRLLNDEPNQEKFFYGLLLKYRQDHLENYQGPGIEYSASDYHHVQRLPRRVLSSRRTVNRSRTQSRQSQFSIVSNRSRRAGSHSVEPETPRSLESYDPFRPSRNPLPDPNAPFANITVLREQPHQPASRNGSLRPPAVTRPSGAARSYVSSSAASSARTPGSGRRRHSGVFRYASRSTYASTAYRSSPPVVVRAPSSARIRVAFNHSRRSSNTSSLAQRRDGARSRIGDRRDPTRSPSGSPATQHATSPGSPALSSVPPVRSRKGGPGRSRLAPIPRHLRKQSELFKEEARKVSSELEKYCDEAFQSSTFSGDPVSVAEAPHGFDSPATSAAGGAQPTPSPAVAGKDQRHARVRGDPFGPPHERPLTTPLGREDIQYPGHSLLETRERLKQRAAEAANSEAPGYLDDVIAHLDQLMQPSTVRQVREHDARRAVSTGSAYRSPNGPSNLPAISEEGRYPGWDGAQNDAYRNPHGARAASAPYPPRPAVPEPARPTNPTSTIRLVPPSNLGSMAPVAPLNVRKRSEQVVHTTHSAGHPGPGPLPNRSSGIAVEGEEFARGVDKHLRALVAEQADVATPVDKPAEPRQARRFGWFKRNATAGGKENQRRSSDEKKTTAATNERKTSFDDLESWLKGPVGSRAEEEAQPEPAPEPQKRKGPGTGKKGFFKMFGRRGSSKDDTEGAELSLGAPGLDDSASASSLGRPSKVDVRSSTTASRRRSGQQPQRHWLARFFHIKPASRIICFVSSKARMRREIAALLRGWKKYGLRDVMVDKYQSIVSGRVDANNALGIKPVSFRCEVFTVLEHGRRAHLSMARFTQEQGAASSFYRVVDTVTQVLMDRGLVVQDPARRRAMERVLLLQQQQQR